MLARQVATLDILSGGRAELGIGAGAFWDAIAAMGGPRRTAAESVAALREAIGVIRALWKPGHGARLTGEHYSLQGAKPGPFPVHDAGIWVGSYKERMLRLTGELADGWLPSAPYAPPEQLAAIIDDAAAGAGRSPRDVRRLYNIAGSFAGSGAEFLQGPPKAWAEQLTGLRSLDQRLAPVVDRLHAEHLVIAGVLERVDAALVALVSSPGAGLQELRSAVDLLTDTLLSHLSYEEGELVEPLGRLGPRLYG